MEIDKNETRITPQVIAQFHHRLLALEVELKERARHGVLSERDFEWRLRQLRSVKGKLRHLKSDPTHNGDGLSTDMGLPDLSRCGPQELQVCDAYLQQRHAELKSVHTMLRRITKWVEDSSMGRSGFVSVIMRLSSMRKHIGRVESLLAQNAEETRWVNRYSRDILEQMGGDSQTATTLESLVTTFDTMDRAISRVAALRAKQKKLKYDVQIKEAWLKQQESGLKHYRPVFSPPQPTALWGLRRRDKQLHLLEEINTRKAKVQRFWDSVLAQGSVPPEMRNRNALTTSRDRHK